MIKVTFGEEPKQEEKPFPKLMKSENCTVFFTAPKEGIVLKYNVGSYVVGYYHEGWDMKCFTDYNGPVTIQNA